MTTTATRWGVGQWEAADGTRQAWDISDDEIHRDMGSASRALAELGIGGGDRVLWCSMLSEAGQFWPWIVATMLVGAQLSCADATEAEATRVAMFCRHLEYRAVIGVNGALLDGLDAMELDPASVFAGVGFVAARPDAATRLVGTSLPLHHFVLAGPAVAIGREPGGPAVVDDAEWLLESRDGCIAVTNLEPRANEFRATRTAARGDVVDNKIVPFEGSP